MKNRPHRTSPHIFLAWLVWPLLAGVVSERVTTADSPIVADRSLESDSILDQPADRWQDRLRLDVEYLASDELRGRSAVDDTIELAANHIADRFRDLGLQTDWFDGGPFQPVDVPVGPRPGDPEKNRLVVTLPSRTDGSSAASTGSDPAEDLSPITAEIGEDFLPLAVGAREATFDGELVFVGYGITAPEFDYDDYAGIDVQGRGVIVLRKEPGMTDPESPFGGTETTRHAYFTTKITNAIEHGAQAVVFVNDPASIDAAVRLVEDRSTAERERASRSREQLQSLPSEMVRNREAIAERLKGIETSLEGLADELRTARRGLMGISEAGQRGADSTNIPIISLARDTTDRILIASTGQSLVTLEQEIDSTYRPASRPLPGVAAKLEVSLRPSSVVSHNVLGVLPGKGHLAEETVVVGAHYDHVGMGGFGSLAPGTIAVHNGADDNASGTATMMAAAERLVRSLERVPEHRRIVFIAFTAEERGLLGSKRYVRSPRFPLESTVAMVNMDMVGRLRDNELTVYGIGTAEGLEAVVDSVNENVRFDLHKVATGYGPSDHQSFYEAGVPVLFFFTGMHAEYHRPSDKSDKIDFGGMTRITDMVYGVTEQLAVQEDRPAYAETDRRFRIRRQMTAFLGVTLSDRGDHVVISGTVPDGPADRGGLRSGDLLQRLGERRVRQSSDVLEVLRDRSPGDTLNVHVDRDGQAIDAAVELQTRP